MTYGQIKQAASFFRPALLLEGIIGRRARLIISDILSMSAVLFAMPALIYFLAILFPTLFSTLGNFPTLASLLPRLVGIFFIIASLWLVFFAIQAFFNSYYYKAFDAILKEQGIAGNEPMSFEVAALLSGTDESDITGSFLQSLSLQFMLLRLGIDKTTVKDFLKNRKDKLTAATFNLSSLDNQFGITFVDVALALFRQDKEFSDFLFAQSIQEKDFLAAAEWVSRGERRRKKKERWWSRDALGRIEGIGTDWAYGGAYILDRYTKGQYSKILFDDEPGNTYLKDELEELETILARSEEANALVVGESGGSPMDLVRHLGEIIYEGTVLPALAHKRIIVLDANKLVATNGEKTRFENELIRIFEESIQAGNIILVFDDLPSFMTSASALGSEVLSLMDPYLPSDRIQVIALSDKDRFHRMLETNGMITTRFEVVLVKDPDESVTIRLLQDEAISIESREKIFFSYQSILAIANAAERYFTEGVMPDKAIDLLVELVPKLKLSKTRFVTKESVLSLVEKKTGIPTGEVKTVEKEKLLNLEAFLHKRVIGQNEAVTAIANAMRRARSGVGSPNRPMGSFLFLGPTGVGKTETTKALAEALFGNESKVIRLDMSEYKSADALDKLIGSFSSGKPGVLASALRENPYGVLLLDEFEKTTKEVMDLFLQVLDEGVFSDMSGKKINARNLIIIATSNAGANLIWDAMRSGKNIMSLKDEIVDGIIKSGAYRPELLNRFDGVILFHPIEGENLRQVAAVMLERFRARLRERGIDLEINDAMIDYLMKFGSDPKFGARPMNRAIQDIIEQKVANKIIKGEIKPGQKFSLEAGDLV